MLMLLLCLILRPVTGKFGSKEGDIVLIQSPSRPLQLTCPTKMELREGEEFGEGDCEYPEENPIQCTRLTALRTEIATFSQGKRPLLSQGPLRGDGVGARAFAHIYVMVAADFLGFTYAASSIGDDVTAFGPTKAEEIDWNCFLNLGAGFVKRSDQHEKFVTLEGIESLLKEKKSPMIRAHAYEMPHAFTFLDDQCWYPVRNNSVWESFERVSAQLSSNYRNAMVVRPACPYDAGTFIDSVAYCTHYALCSYTTHTLHSYTVHHTLCTIHYTLYTILSYYTPGTIHSLCSQYAVTMHSLRTHYALTTHSLCTDCALTMHSLCTHYALTMHSLCTHYALTMHSLCTHHTLYSLCTPLLYP
jgi:hypothetical protein